MLNPTALTMIVGWLLLAGLFVAGTVQKLMAPETGAALLESFGLPGLLIWPACVLNALGATCLILGLWLGPMALLLAGYCMVTSVFHYIPDDPWQMSILIKNWAIAGGLLVLSAQAFERP